MSKVTQCMQCMGVTAWDECGGFDEDDHPVCESCMNDYCADTDCDDICTFGKPCPNGSWTKDINNE